ncbi:cysteine hydrolase family protein [Streptomyces sp. Ag109_O5-10]|uniref:cysteine hydrolase family protein n=1 Tax=Streptomyces sp. Ag109_O5-10 TaxID=1855349 RepID=UPI00089D7878|nr:isochorismatase family cysteine hydrolase [Streptomyces sp. Ag109_O5-10]SEF17354.1 Nicotinamidase-related amidase [Streptomyces sp. Ag109_O5-10]
MNALSYERGRIGLLLIDTVNDVFSEDGKAYRVYREEFERIGTLENLKTLLAGAREQGFPVFHAPMSYTESDYTTWKHISGVHHEMFDNRLFVAGSWGADFHPDLAPADGEIVIAPHKNIDVLANTDLEVQMRQHDVEYIAVAGMVGTMCVESTARSCMEHGFHVTTFTDATAAFGGRPAYDAMILRYPLISHATLSAEEFLSATKAAGT